jgi:riboflavin biosynthesis pyrimidine reductase
MLMLLPPSSVGGQADLELAYAWPPDGPWTRLNFIATVDGRTQGPDGRSGSLGTGADRAVFGLLRSTCDVVLVGAGTARAERYRPVLPSEVDGDLRARTGLSAVPPLAVVSRSLDLPSELFLGAHARTIVLTTADAPAHRRQRLADVADVVVVGDTEVDLAAALTALHGRNLTRVLGEGGPALARDLAATGRLDELCLTVRAMMTGGEGRRLIEGAPLSPSVPLELCSVLADGPDLYLRYAISRSTP